MNYCQLYILFFLIFFSTTFALPQSKKTLIVDSDAGTDDYRAIILLTLLNNYDLKAITLSDGTLFPEKGAYRVETLLNCLNINDVDIGTGKKTLYNKPLWRKYAEKVPWSTCYTEMGQIKPYKPAKQLLIDILSSAENNSVVFVCLGSLSNVYEVLSEKKELSSKIEKIIWYNSAEITNGVNYIFAPQAANFVLNVSIPMYIVHAASNKTISYNTEFVNEIKYIHNSASLQILHQLNYFFQTNDTLHLKLWDELAPIFLAYPNLFEVKEYKNRSHVYIVTNYDVQSIKYAFLKILKGEFLSYRGTVFSNFPTDSVYFYNDVNEIKQELIDRYGIEEFAFSVIASEMHHHLGIFTILGVKMGLWAKEILKASFNNLRITSFTGYQPPLSCLNDGIMIATGTTPAFNSIRVDTTQTQPKATFCHQNECVTLTLKEKIYQQIIYDIEQVVKLYGVHTREYWENIRKLALKYWLHLDRRQIFDVN